jgi:myo-inositol-1(or 4)-monophosphatase
VTNALQANETDNLIDAPLASDALEVALEAASAAAALVRDAASGSRDSLEWIEKSSADFVTEVDRASEAKITEVIRSRFPEGVIVGEELTPEDMLSADGATFIVDPLDGTTNFLHGFPHYAISIGVMRSSTLIAAVVVNVPRGDVFTALAGGGAKMNGQAIRVSSIDSTSRALIGTGFPFKNHDLLDIYSRQFVEISRHTSGIRRAGSAALDLADVACGRFDGFWELVLAPWDVAAGILLVREAGGLVTDLDGKSIAPQHGAIAAGNPQIHSWLLSTVQKINRNETD